MRAHELLYYIAAIDHRTGLTPLGKVMAEFPLEPQVHAVDRKSETSFLTSLSNIQLSKMLISSSQFKCSNEILTITAMLSGTLSDIRRFNHNEWAFFQAQDIWVRPHDQKLEADAAAAKAKLTIPGGDHLTLLNVYKQYHQRLSFHLLPNVRFVDRSPELNDKKLWAAKNFVSKRSLTEAESIRKQLERLMEQFAIRIVSHPDETKLHRNLQKALVCGFFMQVAHKEHMEGRYLTIKEEQVCSNWIEYKMGRYRVLTGCCVAQIMWI